jgi:CheY-like chemotaxis protein
MKLFAYVQGVVGGPYTPEDIISLFGGVASETLVCPEPEYEVGRIVWRKIELFPEFSVCVKKEISEPLAGYSSSPLLRRQLNILSTDDDSNIRALLWHMLSDAGHAVEFAKDGEEVFKRLSAKAYDLVILDVNMPKMNGYKVSEVLHDKLPRPPKVIIFTGRDLEKERLQFVCSGADAILSKGTGNDDLLKTIEALFSEKKPGNPAPEPEVFTPEPQPPVIEEFYPAAAAEKAMQPAPRQIEIVEFPAAVPEAAVPKTAEKAPPEVQSPASGRENGGKPEEVIVQLIRENKALKSDLVDIRRVLGHIELEYAQLAAQFEKQALKILGENREVSQKLGADLKKLRNYVTLIILFLLVAVLASVLLSRYPG